MPVRAKKNLAHEGPGNALDSFAEGIERAAKTETRETLPSFCIVMGKGRRESEGEPMAGTLMQVTDTNFHAEVLENDGPVLVDFWAPWCGPCRVVAPVLEEIAAERENLRIVKLNIDENQETAARYQVLSIPTMILFKGGEPVKTVIGAYPKKRLEQELEPALAAA
jgi:thioredoxin 1